MRLLETKHLSKNFGRHAALCDVSLTVDAGGMHGLMGANGAGKTTLFHCLSGLHKSSSGEIFFKGENISELSAFHPKRSGMARTFQRVKVAYGLNVIENIMFGFHRELSGSLLSGLFSSIRIKNSGEKNLQAKALVNMQRASLVCDPLMPADALDFVSKRKLEIARSLCASPEILLLDEPASGLGHDDLHELAELLTKIAAEGVTILMVEHNVSFMMKLCSRITVLDHGRIIAEGSAAEIRSNPLVLSAYLGESLA